MAHVSWYQALMTLVALLFRRWRPGQSRWVMLQDEQLESYAVLGCMWCAGEEENGTVLWGWSALGMALCLPRKKK